MFETYAEIDGCEDVAVTGEITHAEAYVPMRWGNTPEDSHPEEGGEIEFQVTADGVDVTDQLSEDDLERIEQECLDYMERQKKEDEIAAAENRMDSYYDR